MTNSTLLCRGCKDRFPKDGIIRINGAVFHSYDCATTYAANKGRQAIERKKAREDKEFRSETRRRKEKAKGRLDYYGVLGKLVNQYVKGVLREGEPCYTCGKQQSPTDAPQAFHAGHYKPAKRTDPRRFMVQQIRIQCFSCNSANSGRGAEYRKRMIYEIGLARVEWIECDANHKPLKEQYPEISDIKKEIKRYRQLIRAHGLTPNA